MKDLVHDALIAVLYAHKLTVRVEQVSTFIQHGECPPPGCLPWLQWAADVPQPRCQASKRGQRHRESHDPIRPGSEPRDCAEAKGDKEKTSRLGDAVRRLPVGSDCAPSAVRDLMWRTGGREGSQSSQSSHVEAMRGPDG